MKSKTCLYFEGLVCSEGKVWTDQRKFTLRHLKDLGFGKQPMENLIREELNELICGIRYTCCDKTESCQSDGR